MRRRRAPPARSLYLAVVRAWQTTGCAAARRGGAAITSFRSTYRRHRRQPDQRLRAVARVVALRDRRRARDCGSDVGPTRRLADAVLAAAFMSHTSTFAIAVPRRRLIAALFCLEGGTGASLARGSSRGRSRRRRPCCLDRALLRALRRDVPGRVGAHQRRDGDARARRRRHATSCDRLGDVPRIWALPRRAD